MIRLEVSDQDKDSFRRMLNSRTWALLMLAVKEDCQTRRKNVMTGSHDDFVKLKIDIAKFQTLKEFVTATYAAADLSLPTEFQAVFE